MSTEVVNAADLAIFAGAIEQICSEMDTALERCAFSPIISEAVDRASGIYSALDGGVIAQGHRGLPIFAGCMQYSVKAFLEEVDDARPGDVYMLNDPYRGGTHLMDVRLITPFHMEGELICVLEDKIADLPDHPAGGGSELDIVRCDQGLGQIWIKLLLQQHLVRKIEIVLVDKAPVETLSFLVERTITVIRQDLVLKGLFHGQLVVLRC